MFPSEHVPCLAEMHEESALRAAPWNLDGVQQKRNQPLGCMSWPGRQSRWPAAAFQLIALLPSIAK